MSNNQSTSDLVERVARAFVQPLGYTQQAADNWEGIWVGNQCDTIETGSLEYLCKSLAQAAISVMDTEITALRNRVEKLEGAKFVVVNIGCIECGVSSGIVGRFADRARADELAARCDDQFSWREGGQNSFEVFELGAPEEVAEEYLPARKALEP